MPYDPAKVSAPQLDHGTLVLLSDWHPKQPILTEEDSTQTVVTDDGAIYFDEHGKEKQGASARHLRPRPGARPAAQQTRRDLPVGVSVRPDPRRKPDSASSALTLVEPGSPLSHRIDFPKSVTFPQGQNEPMRITITAIDTGPLTLVFTLNGQPPGAYFPGWASAFTGVRVLPDDDYSKKPDKELTWDFLYETVFRYYYLIFPAMSKIIPFNNQKVMEAAAPDLVRRTDPALWHSTRYMPITRDLSKGKRELIVRWARIVSQRSQGSTKPPRPRPPRKPDHPEVPEA